MSKIYKLKLKPKSGLLTKLESDTIFGHFCWRLKENLGEEKLKEFLSFYEAKNPVFTISNGLYETGNELFFPKPLKLTNQPPEKRLKKEKIKDFLINKELKNRKFITIKQLNLYIKNRKEEFRESFAEDAEIEYISEQKNLKVSVAIDRESFRSAEGKLFSYNPTYLTKSRENEENYYSILIKVIDEENFKKYKCEETLKVVFEIGYGKKKSSGYGAFEVVNYEEYNRIEETEETNGFYTLSNYLPSENDGIEDFYLKYLGKFFLIFLFDFLKC